MHDYMITTSTLLGGGTRISILSSSILSSLVLLVLSVVVLLALN